MEKQPTSLREELRRLGGWFGEALEELSLTRKLVLFGILVGLASGLVAFAYDSLIVLAGRLTVAHVMGAPWYWRAAGLLSMPAAGACLGAVVVRRWCPGWSGHGANEVLAAIRERSGQIEGRVAWAKSLASALTIGLGGSAGREGPVIQVGAAAGSWVGQRLRVSPADLKVLAAAGAAAGLGAAFGTPLTAVFFTMEVVLKDFASESFPAVVIAALTGVVTSRFMLGSERFLFPLAFDLRGPADLALYGSLGLVCAPLGSLYMLCLGKVESRLERPARESLWAPAVGGVLVGAIALYFPRVMGTGQRAINEALQGTISIPRMGALSLLKIGATSATLGTGGSGGAMMPSLFIGAMGGAAWGGLLESLWGVQVRYGAFALVGMASTFTAAFQAPVTGMVLALEISQNYEILPPAMLACILAHLITRRRGFTPTIER